MIRHFFALVFCLSLSNLLVAPAVASHWSRLAEVNNSVCNAFFIQDNSVAVSDGAGGVIVAWQDLRNELYYYIYAQRISANGDPMWTTDGVLLSTAGFNQQIPEIVADGAGGAFVVWVDQRTDTGDLYAQRISANGTVLWTPTGVPVAVAANIQTLPKGVTDGAGGVIFTWADQRGGANLDVYAQRLNGSGVVQWAANGVVVSAAANSQLRANLASDKAGGAIIAWEDYRNDPAVGDIFAQRVRSNGTMAWTANGVPVAVQPFQQTVPVVTYAVGNGAYVAWQDSRAGGGADFHIYYQRLFSTGAPAFAVNGVKVSALASGDHFRPQMVDGGSSLSSPGMTQYIVWEHQTAGGAKELMLNEVTVSGLVLIEVPISFGDGDKLNPHIARNEEDGGVLISWTSDNVYGPGAANIFVTKYHGSFEFASSGVSVCLANGSQGPSHVVSDLQGGAIVVWDDLRDGPGDGDIRAQRVDFTGTRGYASADFSSIVDQPQDQGKQVVVSWDRSFIDDFFFELEMHYSLWRRYQNPSLVATTPSLNADARLAGAIAAGVSPKVAEQQLASGWELVGTVPAVHLPNYALTAPTYGDYIDASSPRTGFMVVFETEIGNWFSAPDSGNSIDNLVPLAPELAGSTAGTHAQLNWVPPDDSPDVVAYRLYRSFTPGVVATPGTQIATVPDLDYLDLTTGGHTRYYVVTAIDDANQESPVSNEVAAPIGVASVQTSAPEALSLVAAGQNPFRDRAKFRIGLPAGAEVSISVYDVNGRQVHETRIGHVGAGWHEYRFEGEDHAGRPLGAGAYFARLQAGTESRTMKFVLMK